jgi:ATP-dependent protease ClpP protease subunit
MQLNRLPALLCLIIPLILAGCSMSVHETTHIRQNFQTTAQWLKSPAAQRGFIFISGEITRDLAEDTTDKIITLDQLDTVDRITLIINSNGGGTASFRVIYNAIRLTQKPVDAVNMGNCYSAAAAIFAAATGKKTAYPNTHFMIHKPQTTGTKKHELGELLNFETATYESVIRHDTELPDAWFPLTRQSRFFTAQEALKYEFIDKIIEALPATP